MMPCVSHKSVLRAVVLAFSGWAMAVSAQTPGSSEITQFRVPEFDAAGVLKSEIFGERARPLPGTDLVSITGLRIVMYKNKDVDSTLTAAHCTINRKDKRAFSNADVRIIHGNVVITGTGFRWMADTQRIEILNHFHMVMVGNAKMWPLVKENIVR